MVSKSEIQYSIKRAIGASVDSFPSTEGGSVAQGLQLPLQMYVCSPLPHPADLLTSPWRLTSDCFKGFSGLGASR